MATHEQAKLAGTPTWVELVTPDIEAARAFYHSLFGWEYDIGGPEYGGYTTARLGRRTVAGIFGQQEDEASGPVAWSLYFATDNVEADLLRAEQLGARVLYPATPMGEFGNMAIGEDPTGAAFCFWQAGQHVGFQAVNEPGAPAWFELYSLNARQARDFYAALLNATADPAPGNLEYYVLKHGSGMLAGIMQIDPSWGAFRPQWLTYFGVANVDETVALASKLGGKQMGPIDDSPFGRFAALTDPSGASFKVIEVLTR